ncbi:5'-methylthioadenosine nucleosidase [Mesomycoplasma ovipneumoniae]|uniref:phosphorylase family protein n=1 Tax=Mesomycoplasma ovipneumoniae TaxID=29562 RepID=UPI00307FF750
MKNIKIKTAIFYADKQEQVNLELLGAKFIKNVSVLDLNFPVYEYKNIYFFYIHSQIGLINSAIFAQTVAVKFLITNIINYGACGGSSSIDFSKMKNQLIFPKRFYLIDAKTPWYEPGQLPFEPKFYENNLIATQNFNLGSSNSFIFEENQVKDFQFVDFFDMEAFSFAQISAKNKLNFYCIKYLSDKIGQNLDISQVNFNIKQGAQSAAKYALGLLEKI